MNINEVNETQFCLLPLHLYKCRRARVMVYNKLQIMKSDECFFILNI